MKKFLRLYTRMTNCCLIFSLQAGVVIIGVLGITWSATSMLINLFLPHESNYTSQTVVQYIIAYLVLILICGGHVWILLAGSWANPNLVLLGFLMNTIIMLLWLMLSTFSYVNSPGLRAVICIEGRCPDVLWLFDAYWRDTGIKCAGVSGGGNALTATRTIFSIAPVLGYIAHWPDYLEQPGMGTPCYENIPDTDDYVAYDLIGNSSCPRADWMSWDPAIIDIRKQIEADQKKFDEYLVTEQPDARMLRAIDNNFNRTILNTTAVFNQYLQQGCELNEPRYIVVSLAFAVFFASFFLYGRAVEFNYYHELIMPFTLERGRFRPPKVLTGSNIRPGKWLSG